jgi:Flp pilus assembly protein TadB
MKVIPEWRCMECLETYQSKSNKCPNCGSTNIRQMQQLEKGDMEKLKNDLKEIARHGSSDISKYEAIYHESKRRGTSYHVGYGKIVLSFWSFIVALVVVWFSLRIGLVLFGFSVVMFIVASLQKRKNTRVTP